MSAPKEATEKMYYNADKTKFVREGSTEAASLAAVPGDPYPELAEPETKTKKSDAHTDKAAEASGNKAAK